VRGRAALRPVALVAALFVDGSPSAAATKRWARESGDDMRAWNPSTALLEELDATVTDYSNAPAALRRKPRPISTLLSAHD
jgi:hypothetical protein